MKDVIEDKCCDSCKFYAELKAPYQRSDGVLIFGYCFAAGDKNYSANMGKGFPVFIHNGKCEKYKRAKNSGADLDLSERSE